RHRAGPSGRASRRAPPDGLRPAGHDVPHSCRGLAGRANRQAQSRTAMSVRRTFTHEALLCGEGDDYIKLVGSVIRSGLDDDGFVLFTAPPDRLDPLRADLGVDADVVTFRDITHMRNPTGRL